MATGVRLSALYLKYFRLFVAERLASCTRCLDRYLQTEKLRAVRTARQQNELRTHSRAHWCGR